jgi:hypothetical protein
MARTGTIIAAVSDSRVRGVLVEVGCATEVGERTKEFETFTGALGRALCYARPRAQLHHVLCPGTKHTLEDERRRVSAAIREEVTVRRWKRVGSRRSEHLGAAEIRSRENGVGCIVAARTDGVRHDVALHRLLDRIAAAVAERTLHGQRWRDLFAVLPKPVDWVTAALLVFALQDPELDALLLRDDDERAIADRGTLARIEETIAARIGGRLKLTECAMFDLSEDPAPSSFAGALPVQRALPTG